MVEGQLVRLVVNGTEHDVVTEPRRSLADVLRTDLGYTGTHVTCEQGICGVCTVVMDGVAVRSCLVLGVQADDCSVETVESLADGGDLAPLQQAFVDNHGLQCGFCTPGFLMLLTAFLRDNPRPTDDEIRLAVSANLCRCTGYRGIMNAVRTVRDAGVTVAPAPCVQRAACRGRDAPEPARRTPVERATEPPPPAPWDWRRRARNAVPIAAGAAIGVAVYQLWRRARTR